MLFTYQIMYLLCLGFILLSKTQRMYMQQQIKTDHNNLSDQLAGKDILLLQCSVDLGYTYALSYSDLRSV